MFTIDTLTTFLGWCAVLNMGVLVFSTIALIFMKGMVSNLHSKLLGVEKEKLPELYFQYLGTYKIAIIILNIVPYVALKLMV